MQAKKGEILWWETEVGQFGWEELLGMLRTGMVDRREQGESAEVQTDKRAAQWPLPLQAKKGVQSSAP